MGSLQTLHLGANFLLKIILILLLTLIEICTILSNTHRQKIILVEIFDTVNPICSINCELNPFQTFVADNAREALWMVRLPVCSENSIQYRFSTHATFF